MCKRRPFSRLLLSPLARSGWCWWEMPPPAPLCVSRSLFSPPHPNRARRKGSRGADAASVFGRSSRAPLFSARPATISSPSPQSTACSRQRDLVPLPSPPSSSAPKLLLRRNLRLACRETERRARSERGLCVEEGEEFPSSRSRSYYFLEDFQKKKKKKWKWILIGKNLVSECLQAPRVLRTRCQQTGEENKRFGKERKNCNVYRRRQARDVHEKESRPSGGA